MPSGITASGFPIDWWPPGRQFVKIADFAIEQQTSVAPGFIVKKGETFNYRLNLEFSELLGQLGGGGEKIKIGIFAHDLSTGSVLRVYGFDFKDFDLKENASKPSDSDTQKTFDHTDADFKFTNANTLGVFLLTVVVIVPATGMGTITSGPLLMVFP